MCFPLKSNLFISHVRHNTIRRLREERKNLSTGDRKDCRGGCGGSRKATYMTCKAQGKSMVAGPIEGRGGGYEEMQLMESLLSCEHSSRWDDMEHDGDATKNLMPPSCDLRVPGMARVYMQNGKLVWDERDTGRAGREGYRMCACVLLLSERAI